MQSLTTTVIDEQKERHGVLIQRLIILHLDLYKFSTGKENLDEDASEEELTESILYFRNNENGNERTSESTYRYESTSKDNSQESIKFSGLVTALYTLPISLSSSFSSPNTNTNTVDERAREIDMEKCLIVYEPLEDSNIVAVAQIPHQRGGGTPVAVRAALRRSHTLFRLLRGGGIHRRLALSQDVFGDEDNFEASTIYMYKGMNHLYQLRKRKRRLLRQSKNMLNNNEFNTIQEEIVALSSQLPIASLRNDLRVHYDAFINETSLLFARGYRPCQSIVECIPATFPYTCDAQVATSALALSSPVCFTNLDAHLQTFLDQDFGETKPKAVAVSTFVAKRLISTKENFCEHHGFNISKDTASLLFWYFETTRIKMQNQKHSKGNYSVKKNVPFTKLALSAWNDFEDNSVIEEVSISRSSFLPAPSLSLLSASDDSQSFVISEGQSIWAPHITLPLECTNVDRQMNTNHILDVRVSMLNVADVTFLLYIVIPSSPNSADASVTAILEQFDNLIQSTMQEIKKSAFRQSENTSTAIQMHLQNWQEPGQDIIVVDRKKATASIFFRVDADKSKQIKPPSLLNYFRKKSWPSETEEAVSAENLHALQGIDCRHLFASTLSLKTVMALDDAYAELQQGASNDFSKEICTLLQDQWIYAYAENEMELYAILDTKLYVTMADVEKAVKRMQRELLNA